MESKINNYYFGNIPDIIIMEALEGLQQGYGDAGLWDCFCEIPYFNYQACFVNETLTYHMCYINFRIGSVETCTWLLILHYHTGMPIRLFMVSSQLGLPFFGWNISAGNWTSYFIFRLSYGKYYLIAWYPNLGFMMRHNNSGRDCVALLRLAERYYARSAPFCYIQSVQPI